MNVLKSIFFLVITFLLPDLVIAQDWVSYQSQRQINDLVETDNELYMATDAGLVVMNKTTLEKTIFNKANSSLTNNHIQSITLAPNGETYIGTYDVVMGRFDGTDFQEISTPEHSEYNPETTELYDFKIAPNGDLWLGTTNGVFHKQGQTWSHYDEDEMGPMFFEAWDIEINSEGEVLIASLLVHKFADGIWSNISDTTQLLGYNSADLFYSSNGDLFFAGDLDQIGRFDGEQWYEYDNGGFNGSEVIKFTEDTDGNVYYNTRKDGIFKFEGDSWTLQTNDQTAAFDGKSSYFYIDEQNNHWLNDNIHLSVNQNGSIQSTLISKHTLENNWIDNIHKGENGNMYFITGSQKNFSIVDNDGNWTFLPLPSNSMPFEFLNDFLVFADNDIWLASNEGLYHYDGTDWDFTDLEACASFAMDTQGRIYVRAQGRIYIIEDDMISEYNVNNSSLSPHIISGLGVDSNDNLWIGSFSYEGDNVIQKVSTDGTWTTYDGLDHPAINQPNGGFHFDNDGNVWIPSGLIGAIRYDGTTWSNPIIDNSDDIENTNTFSITSDLEGTLYFAHQYGVTTFSDDVWGSLNIEDVPNQNSSHSSIITFDDDGTLWWGSNRYGVFSYTTEGTTSTFSNLESSIDFSMHPNPAIDYTILDFTIQEKATVNAFIYNNLGQLQSGINLGEFPTGAFQQTVDLSNLSKGVYIVQLRINDKFSTKTIIVQ